MANKRTEKFVYRGNEIEYFTELLDGCPHAISIIISGDISILPSERLADVRRIQKEMENRPAVPTRPVLTQSQET